MRKNKRGHKKKSVLKVLMNRIKLGVVVFFVIYFFIVNKYSTGGTTIKTTLSQNSSTPVVNEIPVKNLDLTVDTDLTIPSNVEASDIDKMLSGTELEGMGSTFVRVEKELRYKLSIYDGLSLS